VGGAYLVRGWFSLFPCRRQLMLVVAPTEQPREQYSQGWGIWSGVIVWGQWLVIQGATPQAGDRSMACAIRNCSPDAKLESKKE